MPSRAPRPCTHPGCPELVTLGSRCQQHQREQFKQKTAVAMTDERKREDKRFYDSALWQKVRAQVLMKEPYCRECRRSGRVELATMVDHIDRIQAGGSRVAASNLQPLCEYHHAVKRQKESREAKVG
jgi:5-methylcytosine-specific restriction protein A